jgi:hypothetical protein
VPSRRSLSIALLSAAVLAVAAPLAAADTLQVTTTDDAGAGSLRDVIGAANAGDTIHVPAGTYLLSSHLQILKPLTILGDGARSTVLDAQSHSRIFTVSSPALIGGLTLTHGSEAFGGAIDADAPLTLNDDAIIANAATTGSGGGIYATDGLTLNRDLVAHNSALGDGGGIELLPAKASTSAIDNSTIAFNGAVTSGGGIAQETANSETLLLLHDTFSGNEVDDLASEGGSLFVIAGSRLILDSDVFAAGLAASASSANCAVQGQLADEGFNAEQAPVTSCGLTNVTDLHPADVQLGPLQDNGGPTDTMLPAGTSPLVEAADTNGCSGRDQRGVPVPQGTGCDIGAVERTSDPSATAPAVAGVTATSATLNASAHPAFLGGSATFAYGIGQGDGATTPTQLLAGGFDPLPVSAVLTGLKPATTYLARLVVHTAIGDASSSAIAFTTLPAPAGRGGGTLKPTAPRITGARLTHKRFRVSKRATAISARATRRPAPLGTSFRFTLTSAATVRIAIAHTVGGLRKGRSCVAPTATLKRAHAHACGRTVTLGTLTRRNQPASSRSVAFSGRIGRTVLKPGRYVATIAATNAGGSATPVRLVFTVTR